MARKLHAADIADRELIAQAVSFTTFQRRSPTDKTRNEHQTLAAAAIDAVAIRAADPIRDVLVYAILEAGTSIPVPKDMQKAAIAEARTYSSRFNANRAALTSGLQPGRFEIVKTADGKFAVVEGVIPTAPKPVLPEAPAGDDVPAFVKADYPKSVHINDLHKIDHPLLAANAASWPSGPKRRKPKPETAPAADRASKAPATGKRAAAIEAAKRGELPAKPDFSKPTHARFRAKLDQLAAMADAGDLDGLKAFEINPISSSRQAMDRYRNLAVMALEARQQEAA